MITKCVSLFAKKFNTFFISLAKLAEKRVKKYGAQYYTFAIFGIINYPLAYLYELFTDSVPEEIYLRLIATILCIVLLLKDKWPKKLQKFLPLYWYFTISISLPILTSFLLLKDNLSLAWLMNFNVGVMIAILLFDWISFLIIEIIGISTGFIMFFALGGRISHMPDTEHLSLFLYTLSCIVILGSIFSRNKEIFNHYIQKNKDDLNRSLELKVLERTKELQQALAVKVEFLNNISHEVRTPVHGFTALSEGLANHWKELEEDKKHKYAINIATSAKRLEKLVTALLDTAKFNANKMEMNFGSVNLKESIEIIIEECNKFYMSNKDIRIDFINEDSIMVIADQEKLEQVLRNLFYNAIKFTPDGGNIEVSVTIEGDIIHFSIKDSGVGIPEEELTQIFEQFTQSSRTKTGAGGTGLGLYISKKIINAHHGKIWAENNQSLGATFHFTIPLTYSMLNPIL